MFHLSTPAPRIDGTTPAPWRVASTHRAVETMVALGFADAYAVHESRRYRGQLQLFVGLRSGPARLPELRDALKAAGHAVRWIEARRALYVVDKD